MLSRIRLNHGNFPSHLNKIDIKFSAFCKRGEEDVTIEHIVMKCNRFIKPRKKKLNKCYNDKSIIKPME